MSKLLQIVVCISSAFHSERPVKIKLKDETVATDTAGPSIEMVNDADRCALEEALKIGETHDYVETTTVMAGPPGGEWILEGCACFAVDKAVYLSVSDWQPMDSHGCARILSEFIGGLEPGLILCGDVNSDYASGQVGAVLSEILDMPYISSAIGLILSPDQTTLEIERKLMRGNRLKLKAPLPVVVSIDPAAAQPRYISIHNRLRSNLQKRVSTVSIDRRTHETGPHEPFNRIRITDIGPVRLRPKKTAQPDSTMSAQERLAFLMAGGKKESSTKSNQLVEGDTEKQVNAILECIKANTI